MSQSYAIKTETRSTVEIFTLRQADKSYAQVVPGLGNNCWVFHVQYHVFEPVSFEDFYQLPTRYGMPILFPFPNRIKDGKFSFRGQPYEVNPKQHGFVRDKQWSVHSFGASDHEGAWLTSRLEAVQYPEQILQQFPFPFRLDVTYRLRDNTLAMENVVQNMGKHDMPLGFGIHPYFRCPKQGSLQVPARKRWELLGNLPTGNLLEVEGLYDFRQPRNITQVLLDDIFTDLIADDDGLVRCILNDHQKGMATIVEFPLAQFPHVVVFTPPAPRRAICIEPYSCPTDGFNLKSNLIVLQPEEMIRFNVCIYTRISAK